MNKRPECDLDRFMRDVATHALTIHRDEGLYRHLQLQKANHSWDQRFEIVTFPGSLVYTGDMGTFVFSRIPDMFQFFRRRKDRPLDINPHYWREKCDAADQTSGGDGIREWDADAFRECIRGILDSGDATAEERELVDETVLIHADDNEILAKAALMDFHCETNTNLLNDLDGFDPTVYTFRYLWACYAIVWSIDLYDIEVARRATLTGQRAIA